MKISIVIPVYEMNGKGEYFLKKALDSIEFQSFKDYETVIADHSLDNKLENLCKNYEKIVFIKTYYHRGSSSANLNNGLMNCSGELIKILMQDDFLFTSHALQRTVDEFKGNWLVSKYYYTSSDLDYSLYTPRWNDNILFENTIGCPSCLTIKNEDLIYFDPNLIWYMDADYYYRLHEKYGNPTVLCEPTVIQFLHKDQITNTLITKKIELEEQEYLKIKYGLN